MSIGAAGRAHSCRSIEGRAPPSESREVRGCPASSGPWPWRSKESGVGLLRPSELEAGFDGLGPPAIGIARRIGAKPSRAGQAAILPHDQRGQVRKAGPPAPRREVLEQLPVNLPRLERRPRPPRQFRIRNRPTHPNRLQEDRPGASDPLLVFDHPSEIPPRRASPPTRVRACWIQEGKPVAAEGRASPRRHTSGRGIGATARLKRTGPPAIPDNRARPGIA